VGLRDYLELCAPRLCRYARALVSGHPGPCSIADDLTRSILVWALEDGTVSSLTRADLDLRLYTQLTGLNRERLAAGSLGDKVTLEKNKSYLVGHALPGNCPFPLR
jgi:RNA polymerase sigma-70 factor, ECF subfamily